MRAAGEKAQEDLARVAQHHHEGHQRTLGAADGELAEVAPVHLGLLARQGPQPQVRLGRGRRPVVRHQVAEVIGAARVASLAHHGVEAAGASVGYFSRVARTKGRTDRAATPDGVAPASAARPGTAPGPPCHGAPPTGGRWCPPATSRHGSSAGSWLRVLHRWSRLFPRQGHPKASSGALRPPWGWLLHR